MNGSYDPLQLPWIDLYEMVRKFGLYFFVYLLNGEKVDLIKLD